MYRRSCRNAKNSAHRLVVSRLNVARGPCLTILLWLIVLVACSVTPRPGVSHVLQETIDEICTTYGFPGATA